MLSEDPEAAAFFPISQRGEYKDGAHRPHPARSSAWPSTIWQPPFAKWSAILTPPFPSGNRSAWNNQLALSFFPAQVATVALGLFGAFGLLLSITGTFGLASYTVSKRLRELSIRVAARCAGEADSLGRARSYAYPARRAGQSLGWCWVSLRAGYFRPSSTRPRAGSICTWRCCIHVLLTGSLSVAGPVRRALHIDPANLLREQ